MRLLVLSLISTLLTATAFGQSYTLTVESSEPVAAEGTVYRFYVNALDPTDKMSAVYGNDEDTLLFSTPEGIFNSPINGSWNASGMNPALFSFFPELQDDSFATIGLDLPASEVVGSEDPSLVQDETLVPTVSNYFQTGGTQLQVNSLLGSSWYVLNAASNSFPDDDGRWLIAQITTSGSISGQLNFQVFPFGVGADQVQTSVQFDGSGLFGESGIFFGCTVEAACNYDPAANFDNGSCLYFDVCGICGGEGNDVNNNGLCDSDEVTGCTDES
ncbi:MAG: hypothetical protein ACPGYM_08815, partial [Flavobacteriales bacterium]